MNLVNKENWQAGQHLLFKKVTGWDFIYNIIKITIDQDQLQIGLVQVIWSYGPDNVWIIIY